jgi:carboxymethylenebutenolidase
MLLLASVLAAPEVSRAASAIPSGAAIRATIAAAAATGRAPAAPSSSSARGARSDTARVRLGTATAGTSAFVAWPAGETKAPGIVVIHEWWGMNGQIRDVARRLAAQGYVAIVPDLYHGKVAGDAERAHELSRALDDRRALADLHLAARWLRRQPRLADGRIGVVGFCMGGRLSELFAIDTSKVSAAVMFYGAPVVDSLSLGRLGVPLQAHFGATDEGISIARVGEFKSALQGLGKTAEVYVYPGAGHAFMHEGRPSYHEAAARQAWARTLAFLQKYLKG